MLEEANSLIDYLTKGPSFLLELYVIGKNMQDQGVSKVVTAAIEVKSLKNIGIWCKEIKQRSVEAFKNFGNNGPKLKSIYLCKWQLYSLGTEIFEGNEAELFKALFHEQLLTISYGGPRNLDIRDLTLEESAIKSISLCKLNYKLHRG